MSPLLHIWCSMWVLPSTFPHWHMHEQWTGWYSICNHKVSFVVARPWTNHSSYLRSYDSIVASSYSFNVIACLYLTSCHEEPLSVEMYSWNKVLHIFSTDSLVRVACNVCTWTPSWALNALVLYYSPCTTLVTKMSAREWCLNVLAHAVASFQSLRRWMYQNLSLQCTLNIKKLFFTEATKTVHV